MGKRTKSAGKSEGSWLFPSVSHFGPSAGLSLVSTNITDRCHNGICICAQNMIFTLKNQLFQEKNNCLSICIFRCFLCCCCCLLFLSHLGLWQIQKITKFSIQLQIMPSAKCFRFGITRKSDYISARMMNDDDGDDFSGCFRISCVCAHSNFGKISRHSKNGITHTRAYADVWYIEANSCEHFQFHSTEFSLKWSWQINRVVLSIPCTDICVLVCQSISARYIYYIYIVDTHAHKSEHINHHRLHQAARHARNMIIQF